MIEKIRNEIKSNIGEEIRVTFNGSRNKIEEYDGIISETYPYIFILKSNDGANKSFSYTDVLTNILEIEYKK